MLASLVTLTLKITPVSTVVKGRKDYGGQRVFWLEWRMRPSRILAWLRTLKPIRSTGPVLGLAWYRREHWAVLREVSVDADRLEKTWDEWLPFAEARFAALQQQGIRVEKIVVDIIDMAKWCREMGREVDAPGRAAYVVYRLQQQRMLVPKL